VTRDSRGRKKRKEKRRKNKKGCCTVVLKICMQIRFPSKLGFPFLDGNIS
jgi:hypothetical protein